MLAECNSMFFFWFSLCLVETLRARCQGDRERQQLAWVKGEALQSSLLSLQALRDISRQVWATPPAADRSQIDASTLSSCKVKGTTLAADS